MSWQSILLKPFHPNIVKWLDARPIGHGKLPWFRLTSNAIIDGNSDLRKRYRLQGAYGTVGQLNLPNAGISSIVVNQKGILGSLREASISFKVFDLEEYAILEKLFMVPGISVILEWGWEGTPRPPINFDALGSMEAIQREMIKYSLGVKTDQQLVSSVAFGDPINSSAGKYDGMIGVITNFTSDSTDRGFECSIKIASPNGILSEQPPKMQKYDVQVDRVLKSAVGDGGSSEVGTSETIQFTDVEAVLYAMEYPGSVKGNDVTVPVVSTLDNADQSYATYEFVFSQGFSNIQARIPLDLAGQQYSLIGRDESGVDEKLKTDVSYTVYKSPRDYIGPTIGTDVILEKGLRNVNMGYTFPIRYQKLVTNFTETDQFTYQTYISWRFIEDVLATKLICENYGETPRITVASLDILEQTPGAQYWGIAESRKIRNLPELRSADPTICILPGQIYAEGLETDFKKVLPTSQHYFFDEVIRRKIFPFQGQSGINDPAEFRIPNDPYRGYLRNILVNSKVVAEAYRSANSLSQFLQNILDKISFACGNFWEFHVIANPSRPQLLEIIDEKTVEDKQDPTYKFRVNTVDTKVKSFSTSTKLPQGAAALAFVGARSTDVPDKENSIQLRDSAAFLGYSRGVKDLFSANQSKDIQKQVPPAPIPVNATADDELSGLSPEERIELLQDRAEQDLFNNLPPRERWLNAYANLLMRNFATPEMRSHGIDALSSFITKDHEREAYIDDPGSPSFLLPIEYSMVIDGVSGIFMGNSFIVNTFSEGGPLPDRYKDKVKFQVTNVTHKIGDSWTTDITGMMRLLDVRQTVNSPKQSRQEFAGLNLVFTETGYEGSVSGLNSPASQLTSQANIEALHPAIRDKVRRILDKLKAGGWQPVIASAYRSLQEQKQKASEGASEITFGKHNNVIGTRENPERAALALDIVDRRYSWGNGQGDNPEENAALFFIALAKAAKAEGFNWGGDWRAKKTGTGSEWSRYLKSFYIDGQSSTSFSPGMSYQAGSYRVTGWPDSYPAMGWDPAHIEIYKGARGTAGNLAALYQEVPTWSDAKRTSIQIYGVEL